MRLNKRFIGVFATMSLFCLAALPAMAAEITDSTISCYSAEEMIEAAATEEMPDECSAITEDTEIRFSDIDASETESEKSETTSEEVFAAEEGPALLDASNDTVLIDNAESATLIELDQSALTLQFIDVGEKLTATVWNNSPEDITDDYTVQWTSDTPSVASVNENGEVTAIGNGSATITATITSTDANGDPVILEAQCIVTVNLYTGILEDVTGNTSDCYYYVDGAVYKSSDGKATVQKDYQKAVDSTISWWYVDANGKVDKDGIYNDCFAENQNGWWYIENGKVTFNTNSVIKDSDKVIDGTASWWYVVGSKVKTDFTGLADYSNKNGWWYIENGKVTFTKNTVAKNKNGWWYVTGSKVQFGYTGLANYSNANGWWYIKSGKVDFTKNTVAKNKNGWWYVTGGKVQFGYTGLANYSNANGWWYIKNGKVDFSYEGIAKNKNGYWYVNGGKVIFEDALTYAARFVAAHSTDGASSYQRLSECFQYMRSNYSYTRYYGTPGASDLFNYAKDYYINKTGNCYRYASSFACIAKVLRFETRVAVGKVSTTSGGMSAHGWAEVKQNGTWYICDVNFNVFMKTQSNYPRTLAAQNKYTLTVSKGKASWT